MKGHRQLSFNPYKSSLTGEKRTTIPLPPNTEITGCITIPQEICADDYRVDICLSVADEIAVNNHGVINKVIPACRCVRARHIGSRDNIPLAQYLYEKWLPQSGYRYSGQPIIFHYVNVGPHIQNHEMITDVYLPIA